MKKGHSGPKQKVYITPYTHNRESSRCQESLLTSSSFADRLVLLPSSSDRSAVFCRLVSTGEETDEVLRLRRAAGW